MDRRIILDTNIFVAAAFNPNSHAARIVQAVRNGDLNLVWNDATRREAQAVVENIPPIDWEPFAGLFRPEWEYIDDTFPALFDAVSDPADRKFAALADFSLATLISNDDHLLSVRDCLRTPVMAAGEFAEKELI
jgi:predicted nucleic acid-binding protein